MNLNAGLLTENAVKQGGVEGQPQNNIACSECNAPDFRLLNMGTRGEHRTHSACIAHNPQPLCRLPDGIEHSLLEPVSLRERRQPCRSLDADLTDREHIEQL